MSKDWKKSGAVAERIVDNWVWLSVPDGSRGSQVKQEDGKVCSWVWIPVSRKFRDFLDTQGVVDDGSELDFLRNSLKRFVTRSDVDTEADSKTLELIGDW